MKVENSHWKKVLKIGLALFRPSFNSSKCKTTAKMAVARIKLLRNKRDVVIKQMRRDIAILLESRQDATARIRVEHVIREQNIMAANELIELFCELVVARLTIIAKQRECPADLKEGISSLIFAGPRCADIPELLSIRDIFQKKYGKDFVSTATDLRPNAGVNRTLIEKLSVKTPSGETKLKVLKAIAKEYQVEWDVTESEVELLKPPEERIEGPVEFVSATSLPFESVPKQSPELKKPTSRSDQNDDLASLQDLASAAEDAAGKAMAAAQAAALLAYRGGKQMPNSNGKFTPNLKDGRKIVRRQSYNCQTNDESEDYDEEIEMEQKPRIGTQMSDSNGKFTPNSRDGRKNVRRQSYNCQTNDESEDYDEEIEMEEKPRIDKRMSNSHGKYTPNSRDGRKIARRQSYNCQTKYDESEDYDEETEKEEEQRFDKKMHRRHSYNNAPPSAAAPRLDIKFDESDCEYDSEVDEGKRGFNEPPNREAPGVPVQRVHPKLPDYDVLAARFEALRNHKSQR